MSNEQKGNWWIWKVFWILFVVTTVEVLLGISQPKMLVEARFLDTSFLNHIFIVLTLVKAGYIVLVFMHLGFELSSFKWAILLPAFILIPYLLFILLSEGGYTYFMM